MKLNVARFLEHSRSEGPGLRAVIWVQGCPIRCAGCCNPEMQAFIDKELLEVEDMAERVLGIDDIEGITFLGGEPFSQAVALAELGRHLCEAGLSVTTFTGYTLEALRAAENPAWQALLNVTDLLIAGPFVQERLATDKPWVGSDNQMLHFLTDWYADLQGKIDFRRTNTVEIRVKDGQLYVNGFPYPNMTPALLSALEARGIKLEDN